MPEKDLDYEYPNMLKFILAREGGYVNRKRIEVDRLTKVLHK